MGQRVLCCRINSSDGSSLIGGHGVSGCGDSGGVKKLSFSSSDDLYLGFSGSSAKMLRN